MRDTLDSRFPSGRETRPVLNKAYKNNCTPLTLKPLYVLTQGCTWRNFPGDFPARQTVYTYFRNWKRDGTWVTIHEKLRDWVKGCLKSFP
jgi:transposase